MASVLEVSDTGERYFNVFAAAPENEMHRVDAQQAGEKTADGSTLPEYFLWWNIAAPFYHVFKSALGTYVL